MTTWHLSVSEPTRAHAFIRGRAACGSFAAPLDPYVVTKHAGHVKQCASCQVALREAAQASP